MGHLDKEYIKKLAHQIMIDVNDQEIEELQTDFAHLLSQMQLLQEVDTTGVEPMVYPFEQEVCYLREDHVDHCITQEEALKNVKEVCLGHVKLPKVVK
ncbi:MAG: Asp-tRNA(Asn)/Glu-tRNA(Gln) amidotransferase subunit GatC [Erysipelotrichaceae bacterium]|nr:Asp-tRNA(Asn)/Glu-tRNA(Gln) amidotransferase subunit GatC [Erysipelotrichaceae bacterium]MDE6476172.1 Asp-tRNA(Asn)/Glu-tRNA(Gln) amidotransferase subunit GatC [Erysipelotrichaceae bacterium]